MKYIKLLGFLVMAGVMVFLATGAMAAENDVEWGGDRGGNALALTDEQRSQMKALREEGRTKMEVLRNEMKSKREALRKELDSDNPDRGKAGAIAKDILSVEEQLINGRIDMVFKVRSILTPEQYQKLREMREKKMAEIKEHRGKRGEDHKWRKK